MEQVILVDEQDRQVGIGEKISTHRQGLLHRAFSLWVINSKGSILLQQRALSKYHCGGIWANACCGHPRPGEELMSAMHRRLQEEMGFDCDFEEKISFIYKVDFENGLNEHEFLHVSLGVWDGTPKPNPDEVMNHKWLSVKDLEDEISRQPEKYAYWFRIAFEKLRPFLVSRFL
jgi:isopentenyl-diphosphate delta-isomerase